MNLERVSEQFGVRFAEVIRKAHDECVARMSWDNIPLPERVTSAAITERAKGMLTRRRIDGVARAAGKRDEFILACDGETLRFRVNRARLKGRASIKAYTKDDLKSPTGNGVTSPNVDLLLLWVAEKGAFGDAWLVVPAHRPERIRGTQFRTYDRDGKGTWLSESLRLVDPALVSLNGIHVPAVQPNVHLGTNDGPEPTQQATG